MAENPDPKLPPVNPPVEITPPAISAEQALNDALAAMATLTGHSTNAGSILKAMNVVMEAAKEAEKKILTTIASAQVKLDEITAAATQALAAKTKISDEEAVISTKSAHINDAQKYADKVRAELDRQLTEATSQATAAEAQQAKALTASEAATKELAAVQKTKSVVESEATLVEAARKAAVESAGVAKSLAEKSATIESRVKDYEKRLAEFELKSVEQLTTIETLLRGATSAGLAHSFNVRRLSFEKPQKRWQTVFVGSLVAIVLLALSGLIEVLCHPSVIPTYGELGRMWIIRLPIAGALIWLAMHASREAALAKRLEEDYGYKSAVASCFEGFRKEMSDIAKDATATSPLGKLCSDTLTTIATPPGRIYEKHELTTTPSKEIVEAAKAIIVAAGGKA